MRWKKMQAVLKEHPYLLDDNFHMSMSRARELQEKEFTLSFDEMVECAKLKSDLPDEAWIR